MILKTALIPFVGKSGFVSHTKHIVEATNTDLSFMKDNVRLNFINHLVGFIPCQIFLYFSN